MSSHKRTFNRKLVIGIIGLSFVITLGVAGYYLAKNHPLKQEDDYDPKPTLRASYHFTTPDKWKNDPQRPLYYDGAYHYYYLYNGDYPGGNGTEWRHATSTDLVYWKDEGIAIPKYSNPNGDVWSGSVVVDEAGTSGFGKGAIVALVTQPSAEGGEQAQYLWYSTDRGKSFKAYSNAPVLPNPGTPDFRDPKIMWNEHSRKWIMALAEGTKIGFYESPDLKNWHYTSGFVTENIGLVECPDLYMMLADDGTSTWVLGASANGKSSGKPNTYAYWTGAFDGKTFVPDLQEPQWLDYGFDWYGAVTFEDGTNSGPPTHRYALAWMNNWEYPHNTPTLHEGFNGMDSIVRQIELKHSGDGAYHLVSQPLEALNKAADSTVSYEEIQVNGSATLPFTGNSYELEADISWSEINNIGFRLRESTDKSRHADFGVSVEGGYTYVNRAYTGNPDTSGQYLESTSPFDTSQKTVHLNIFVDKTSVEVFIDEGTIVFSSLIFPELNDQGITLFSEGGTAVFKNVVIKAYPDDLSCL